MTRNPKLYSYVVEHDTGFAPNPYYGVCTLCRCKFRKNPGKPKNIVELAKRGDWVVGTGGADRRRSAGHGKIVYAMRVDRTMTREDYFLSAQFAKKQPVKGGRYPQTRGDNLAPTSSFEKQQFVLISRNFYYFGANAIAIPRKQFPGLEKEGPGFRCDFDQPYICRFVQWLEEYTRKRGYGRGRNGEPCQKAHQEKKGSPACKSSC